MSKSGIAAVAASQHTKEKEYWLEKLSGNLIKTGFPYDNKKITNNNDTLNTVKFSFGNELYSRLIKLSNRSDSRLLMILAAGLNLLLDKYTGNKDIVVGTAIFKQEEEAEFINTVLALRNEINREGTFKELLLQTKTTLFEASENQNFPIETLLYQLGMDADENSFPLFDVAIILKNVQDKKYLEGIRTNVTISFNNTGDELLGEIEYNSILYRRDTIDSLISYLERLLLNATSNVNVALRDISILGDEKKNILLNDFNNAIVSYPQDKTIHGIFEEQVKKTPNGIALEFEDKQLTYSELNQKADVVASVIKEKGVGSVEGNSIVGIMVERSMEMVIGMLAVMKAGGAYMPIDPEYPLERKQFMLKDSGATVLLVAGTIEEGIVFDGNIIDLQNEELESNEEVKTLNQYNPNSLAYIIYTSGSTGQPKGVLINHVNIINTLTWRKEFYDFDNNDVVLQIPSFSFDSSVEDIFTPLISGSKLVLVNQQDRFNIVYLEEVITKQKVTHFLITPGLYKTMLDESPKCLESLRIVTLAGDKFTEDFVKEHFSKLGNVRLINEYGPTENSVCTTAYELTNEKTKVLIGKPINNVKCYIIDKYGSLCPIGIPGELCASGVGLAMGYLNRKELTEEKFIENPFESGSKLYKTGDLAKWLPDGNIEFLGRVDYQVKIRGFRIELGEIESQLLTHEQVTDTLVVAKENAEGNKYLVQYFVSDEKLTVPELKWCLNDALPEYMMPSYFVQLDKMPLTPNGKVDRRALPEHSESATSESEYEEPTNETEIHMVEIWKDILDIEKIGINDNFFEIGGHSLRATVLVSRIRKEFHADVPVREVFKKPTIKELSQYIMQREKSIYVSIEPVEEQEYYPASPAQKRMYLVNKVDGIGVTYNVPLSMCIDGHLDKERTEKTFAQIVERHDAFRTSFEFVNDELVQRVHKNIDFKIGYKEASESELREIEENFLRVFDFKTAPLVRVMLVNLKEGNSVLMFDMHHIISDGVSMDIVVKEFVTLYEGKDLPGLRIQYRDFTVWQNKILSTDALQKQKEYWVNTLSGELPVLNMPTDYGRPSIQSFEGHKVRTSVDSDTTIALLKLANKTGTTLFSVLLGAYNVLLSKYSGQNDIIVGSPIAGRTSSDLENVVGMFINMIALRNYPDSQKAFKDFIKEVGEGTIEAFDNQDYQFNDLVDALKIDRNMSRSPLFDTMFALQNMEFRQTEIEGVPFRLEDIETKVSKFDITVIAIERNSKIDLIFEYCTNLYKKETMERLAEHFVKILNVVSENPDLMLSEISILKDEDRKLILEDFNNTAEEYPKDKTIYELFEEQVQKTPDNTAVVYKDEALSYKELDEKANCLANTLISKYSIKSEDIVAVMVQDSVDIMIGIMGILKAGAAYLPIDPQYPQDRINYMLEDSGAKLLLTQSKYMDYNLTGNKQNPVAIINLDSEGAYDNEASKPVVVNSNKSLDKTLAYVIYTSGSTGKPKGVMVEHSALVNLSCWHNRNYKVIAEDRSTKYAGFGFDASVWEIFPYIIAGASLHIIDSSIKLNTIKLNEYFEKNHITISFLPTQICEQFMDLNNKSLRKLLTGGDKLNQFIKKDYELVNNYGPTENTVVATSCTVENSSNNIPIGKPIDNTQIYILDKNNNIQPVGVPGELCISGDSLARGYINKPELTYEKFVENPFKEGVLMYRTGDLVRWLADGNIEFLGRIDQQVKIRGNRIELGEIENQLLKHDEIKEAVVLARADKGENKYLCAYVVSEKELILEDLKEHLAQELPNYMIPSYFVNLDSLPITPNGKVDIKALPQPDGSISTSVEYVAPTGETEEKIVEIWKEVLEVEKIGINDNFFDLGGNSLLMMKVISKICSVLNISEEKITVMTMFKYPTIALMAKELAGDSDTDTSAFDSVSKRINKRNQAARRSRRDMNEQ